MKILYTIAYITGKITRFIHEPENQVYSDKAPLNSGASRS